MSEPMPAMDAIGLESNVRSESKPDTVNTVQKNRCLYYTVVVFMALLALGCLASMWKFNQFTGDKVQSFVHIHEGNPLGQLSINGPFLGKVRVSGTGLAINNGGDDKKKQSYCDDTSKVVVGLKEACNMMRIPTMYVGYIHATWSVLGAQSIPSILKHIYLICFAFSCFMLSDLYVRFIGPDPTDTDKPRWLTTRWVRTGIVLLSIVAFLVAICLDFRAEMAQYQNGMQKYAIGSVSTGAFFWIATFLIICSSQIDEVKQGAWHKHVNLNMSYLILLLLPLFNILGLLDIQKGVVDVHIQLIFFSSIFFALLDIFQMRVMPVLEDLHGKTKSGDTLDSKQLTQHVLYIQIFVVLACILCKLFVYVPTLELVGYYYIGKVDSFSGIMLVIQIVLLILTSVIDLLHITVWQQELAYTIARTFFVWAIIVASLAMTWTISTVTP